jgi:hypothetical protein
MHTELDQRNEPMAADRIGFAKLTRMAFDGHDLRPVWQSLMEQVDAGTAGAGVVLDLSLIAQLLGKKEAGLSIQADVLGLHRLYRSPCSAAQPGLKVLALAAAIDMGGNTPIEFLLEESGIQLTTLFVVPGTDVPAPLPDHDIAIVVASDSEECNGALADIDRAAPQWPRPMLNPPRLIRNLDRDKLYRLLREIDGIEIPATVRVTRDQLAETSHPMSLLTDAAETDLEDAAAPVIVRPRGSHAGVGLVKIDDGTGMAAYLLDRPEEEFFISRFVDYASEDALFRKYRIVFVQGRPYACHMAIADRWDIWYLNAGMSESAGKRLEEETFMRTFDVGFARRHRAALAGMADRIGLDYFTIDCAENKRGELLIFEADNTAVVHNMDSPELYPYKPPQMRAIFAAFAAMLYGRAGQRPERAA